MPSFNPASPAAEPREASFLGIQPDLCFAPNWLPRNKAGYATLTARDFRGTMCAHRLAFMLLVGRLQYGEMVLHRCGNASCYNPYHLYVGGDAENRRDKVLHQQADRRWGPLGLTYRRGEAAVFMPQPLVLSTEGSHFPVSFGGFKPGECLHSDWLHPTHDGYRQLFETSRSGDVVGAHRKVYTLFNGPLDKYDLMSHSCGDRHCVNPYHLFNAGRHPSPRDFDFENDKRFTLSSEGLARIGDLSKSAAQLAQELGVHPETVKSRRADIRRDLRSSAALAMDSLSPTDERADCGSPERNDDEA